MGGCVGEGGGRTRAGRAAPTNQPARARTSRCPRPAGARRTAPQAWLCALCVVEGVREGPVQQQEKGGGARVGRLGGAVARPPAPPAAPSPLPPRLPAQEGDPASRAPSPPAAPLGSPEGAAKRRGRGSLGRAPPPPPPPNTPSPRAARGALARALEGCLRARGARESWAIGLAGARAPLRAGGAGCGGGAH